MALEAELLRQRVYEEAEAAWAEFESIDAEPGTPEFEEVLRAANAVVAAMEREAEVFGLDG